MIIKKLAVFLLLLCAFTARADEPYVLKFATLAPAGSTWMNVITEWAGKVEKESQGRLKFKFYPGGVSGDEPDMIRKIRFGQIHGAAMTGHGIGSIYSPARVLEIPFLFRNYEEVDYVRAQMMPEIRAGFRKNDYELLGWMELGFIRFFSRTPIHSMDDLKKRRIWLWQGDPLGAAHDQVLDRYVVRVDGQATDVVRVGAASETRLGAEVEHRSLGGVRITL